MRHHDNRRGVPTTRSSQAPALVVPRFRSTPGPGPSKTSHAAARSPSSQTVTVTRRASTETRLNRLKIAAGTTTWTFVTMTPLFCRASFTLSAVSLMIKVRSLFDVVRGPRLAMIPSIVLVGRMHIIRFCGLGCPWCTSTPSASVLMLSNGVGGVRGSPHSFFSSTAPTTGRAGAADGDAAAPCPLGLWTVFASAVNFDGAGFCRPQAPLSPVKPPNVRCLSSVLPSSGRFPFLWPWAIVFKNTGEPFPTLQLTLRPNILSPDLLDIRETPKNLPPPLLLSSCTGYGLW